MINRKLEAGGVYINNIYQEAWIKIDEKGTEAAAVTASTHFSVGCSSDFSMPLLREFHADHPFVFFIIHNPSENIIFSGWISNP